MYVGVRGTPVKTLRKVGMTGVKPNSSLTGTMVYLYL